MTTTIAVVAAGAMGAGVGAHLVAHGAHVVTTVSGRSEATRQRATEAAMHAVSDIDLVAADLFLSIVPPNEAVGLAQRVAAACRTAGRRVRYVDLNAISPQTAHAVAGILKADDVEFVDGGIIGMPPKSGSAGPMVYLSGPTDEALALLQRFGLRTKHVDGGIGAASALKLSYAAITKGLTALGVASMLAAERAGVTDALLAELGASQSALLAYLKRGVPDMLPKAYRWEPEMREIAAYIGVDDRGGAIYEGAAQLYRTIADDVAGTGKLAAILKAMVA